MCAGRWSGSSRRCSRRSRSTGRSASSTSSASPVTPSLGRSSDSLSANLPDTPAPPLATLDEVSRDSAGSSIDSATYTSPALHGRGSFLVYLPSGYASTTARYPVLYLLHGNDQPDSAFLQIGLQGTLDRLIAHHTIPPMIAVMIQGGPGANNWRNTGAQHYESYVLEVQQLVDRMLPTIASRRARAIAGDSMGGYGAMNLALSYPYRYSVVESWLGFFNGLQSDLHADRPILSQRRSARVSLRRRIRSHRKPGRGRALRGSAEGGRSAREKRHLPRRTQPGNGRSPSGEHARFAGHALAQQTAPAAPRAIATSRPSASRGASHGG